MAVNKNFVVKNGLEVNTNLILADATNDRVGIGTTVPSYTLDVAGGIGATSMYIAGITTALGNLKFGSAGTTLTAIGNSVGVGTDAPAYLLDVRSAVSTGQTALYVYGDMRVSGDINLDDIVLDDVRATDLYVTGLSTFVGLTSTGDVRVGAGFSAVGVSSFHNDLNIAGSTGIGSTVHWDASANTLTFQDDAYAKFGNDGDLSIYHSGSHSFIKDSGTGSLRLLGSAVQALHTNGSDYMINATADAGVQLFYGGSERLETTGIGITVQGSVGIRTNLEVAGVSTFGSDLNIAGSAGLTSCTWDASENELIFYDDIKARWGNGGDLNVYHDSSHSYLSNSTGYLHLQSDSISLAAKSAGENFLIANKDGAVEIYYDASKRLETTGIGVTVQGSVGIRTNLEVAGVATITGIGASFMVGGGGTVFYADRSGVVRIGSGSTAASITINGGSVPSIGLVIALGG